MTPETPMRMLERMIAETERRIKELDHRTKLHGHEHGHPVTGLNDISYRELKITRKHLEDLTLLRDKFQQAGKEIDDNSQYASTNDDDSPCWGDDAVRLIHVQRILGFAGAESVTGSKGCNTSEALNPSLSAVRGLKPAKDRRKLGTKEKP